MTPRQIAAPLLLALALVGGVTTPAGRSGAVTRTAVAHAATPAAAKTTRIAIRDRAFAPAAFRVKVGTTVTWTNWDAHPCMVTVTTRLWGSRILARGQTYEHTFAKPGTFTCYCPLYPGMIAKVVVTK